MIAELIIVLVLGQQPGETRPITQSAAQAEYDRLWAKEGAGELTAAEHRLLAALTAALGSTAHECTRGQVYAGLCHPSQVIVND